jgi:ActR/RegA family two-component response regulator
VARRFAPHWAIIDLRLTRDLADRSGLDLADELLTAYPLLRVLIHTGYADSAFRAGRRARIVDYLEKPATIDEICAKLEGREAAKPAKTASCERVERDHAMRVLIDHAGNMTHAADALGISREALRRKLTR